MLQLEIRRTWTAASALAFLGLAGACGSSSTTTVAADVWAVVDGREIRREDVEKAFRRSQQAAAAPTSEDEAMGVKLGIVDELITQDVLVARAQALKIEVSDAEIETAFAQRKGNLDAQAFADELKKRQLSDTDLKQALRRELLADKLLTQEVTSKVAISDENVSTFFNANRDRFNVAEAQYRIAQIVITPVRDAQVANRLRDDATSPAAAQQKLQMLMERLKAGAQFSEVAMDFSEDPQTAPRGGDLGFVPASALAQVQPALRDAVVTAQPGQVNLVSAGGGHTLVLLVAKEEAGQRDLGTPGVRENIRQALQEQKVQLLRAAYITAARDEATVVNHLARTLAQSLAGQPPALAPAAPGGS